ncbi:MAG: flavodoxin FldA [Bacteroidaceae bacterium]|jgi:flavodoxin I
MAKKIGIYYGSSTGTCSEIAAKIAKALGVPDGDVHDVSNLKADEVAAYDVLLLGSSTWGDGELQDDWYDALNKLKSVDLNGKEVGLFGCGDSGSYPDTFCDAIGQLYEELKDTGCTFVGNNVSTDGYDFSSSISVVNGKFVGLAIDDINESGQTDARVAQWVATLKAQCLS